LLVIDEEHEGTYKENSAPRYHARDVAAKRASLCGAVLVLGSATPRLESLYLAERGDYRHIELTRRVDDRPLPTAETVDMRELNVPGERTILSPPTGKRARQGLPGGRAGRPLPQPPRFRPLPAMPQLRPYLPMPELLGKPLLSFRGMPTSCATTATGSPNPLSHAPSAGTGNTAMRESARSGSRPSSSASCRRCAASVWTRTPPAARTPTGICWRSSRPAEPRCFWGPR